MHHATQFSAVHCLLQAQVALCAKAIGEEDVEAAVDDHRDKVGFRGKMGMGMEGGVEHTFSG